jgi:CRP/FNR family transcriptional regulator, anaerobic regulatory protein
MYRFVLSYYYVGFESYKPYCNPNKKNYERDVVNIDKKCGTRNCAHCTGKYCAKKVSIFSVLEKGQINEVVDKIITRRYKKGQMVFFEGDVADKLYIVNQGKVKVYKYTKEGKEQILYVLSDGDFIGDLSLLKKGKFEFNAEALEDTAICTLSKEDFDNVVRTNPEITFKILENVHDRLISLERLVQSLGTKDVEARIAALLLSFIKNFGTETKEGIMVDLPLNREEMGNYIGITRETISRKLTSMQDEGVIELIGNRKLLIKDMEYLESSV